MKKPSKAEIDYWYDLAEASGFEDAEERHSPRQMLKRWHNTCFQNALSGLEFEKVTVYYQRAVDLLNTFEFESPADKEIWALHADGLSVRQIGKKLNKAKSLVHRRVQEIRKQIL